MKTHPFISICKNAQTGISGRFVLILLAALTGNATAAELSWTPPTVYTDGSPLTVSGYKVYCAPLDGKYGSPVPTIQTSGTFPNCAINTQWVVTALDSKGTESAYSNVAYDDSTIPSAPVLSCSPIVASWKVVPWRKGDTTRTVYKLNQTGKTTQILGQIPVGTICGDFVQAYSATVKVWEWRKVLIDQVTGVTVCGKSL